MRATAVIALLWAAAAGAAGGRLLSVQPVAGDDWTVVQLDSDQPLSFTTLKLAAPPRVVVDFAETAVGDVPAEQDVGDGAVRRIAVAAAGSHTARVVIELVADADFDVRAAGTRVEVRIPRPAMVAKRGPPPPSEEAQAPPQQAQAPVQEAQATAQEAQAPVQDAQAAAQEAHTPAGRAEEASGKAAAAAAPSPTAEEVVAAAPVATAAENATAPASANAPARADPVPAAAPPPTAQAAVPPEAQERAALPTVALVGSQRPPASAVQPPERKPPPGPLRPKGRPAITGIGFRPDAGGEVLVRSDRPLQYGVSSSDRVVLLHLPDTAIPVANNRRPLDTRFFGGTVQRIVPHEVKGGTEVRIELREPAEVHLNQSGSLLTLSFTPGS